MRLTDYPRPFIDDDQVNVYDDAVPVTKAVGRHLQYLVALAHRFGEGDEDFADDLYQAGQHALWRHDISRYAEESDQYVRSIIRSAVLHKWRRELTRRRMPLGGVIRQRAMEGRAS